jgi:hypothetical protein
MDYILVMAVLGEVLLKYFVNDDQTITFEINQSLLYQNKKRFQNILEPSFMRFEPSKITENMGRDPMTYWIFFVYRIDT